ncbi:DeoR family transcriptional regulator [Haloactinopolyspora alba]|uniref:DeoR family transcriptional regulator n=1 Tax=Haloactinopolyspora alba TaxID=648780 RepID=A0A2P8E9C9_9ACTN|nr:DeoR/GlpR family DNA-binding transcription regulator [Haloactinopolyspora alba]PSL06048.1 DeoR family transcriptional regulator [Haloactinopolyspora alba]
MSSTVDGRDHQANLRYDAAPQRRAVIVNQLRRSGHVSVSDVAQLLSVSEMTVRRDLRRLAATGDAVLVHGGASLPPGARANPAFVARAMLNSEGKRRIGQAAAAMVPPDATVGVDAGTTALEVANALPEEFSGCVVTHSVPVLAAMMTRPSARTIAVGGELSQENQALIGSNAAQFVGDLRLRVMMLGAAAIDTRGAYVRSELELGVKRAMLDVADQVILLCDVSKENAAGTVRVCGIDRVDTVVTDAPLGDELTARLHEGGTRIVVA